MYVFIVCMGHALSHCGASVALCPYCMIGVAHLIFRSPEQHSRRCNFNFRVMTGSCAPAILFAGKTAVITLHNLFVQYHTVF